MDKSTNKFNEVRDNIIISVDKAQEQVDVLKDKGGKTTTVLPTYFYQILNSNSFFVPFCMVTIREAGKVNQLSNKT